MFPDKFLIHNDNQLTRRQGYTRSCVSFSIIGVIEYTLRQSQILKQNIYLSPRFLHSLAVEAVDLGTSIENVLQIGIEYGVPTENTFPYYSGWLDSLWQKANLNEKPPKYVFTEAMKYKIESFFKISPSIEHYKKILTSQIPIIVLIKYADTTFDWRGRATKTPHKMNNLHACVLVGYDETKGEFIFRNTWDGLFFHWGDHGYGYIPYSLFEMITIGYIVMGVQFAHQDKNYKISFYLPVK